MNIERMLYSPGEEEHKLAHESMFKEQTKMTREREETLDNEVIEKLTEKGTNNDEAMAALQRWIDLREQEAYLRDSSRAQIEKAIEAAKLYKRAGYFREALEELESTEEAAASESDDLKLYSELKDLEDEIREGGSGSIE